MTRFLRAGAGLVAVLVTLAGCAALADVAALSDDLRDAGYRSPSVDHETRNGYSTLSIAATSPAGSPPETDGAEVSELVWTTYHGDVDRLRVVLDGRLVVDETAEELRSRFGARPAGLDDPGAGGGTNVVMIVVVVVVALVFTG
jgi:hypothetical protein